MAIDERYRTVPNPPSRGDYCRNRLKSILEVAIDEQDKEDVVNASGPGLRHLVNFLFRNDLLTQSGGDVNPDHKLIDASVDSEGFRERVVELVSDKTIGFYDILFELLSEKLIIEELYEVLLARYDVNWKTKTQVKNRVDWLRALGFVFKPQNSRHYELTERGGKYVIDKCSNTVVHPRQVVDKFESYTIDVVDMESPFSPPLTDGQLARSQPFAVDSPVVKNRDISNHHLVLLHAKGTFYGYGEITDTNSGPNRSQQVHYRYFEEPIGGGSVNGLETDQKTRAAHVLYNGSHTFKNAFDHSNDYQPYSQLELSQPKSRNQTALPNGDSPPESTRPKEPISGASIQTDGSAKEERSESQVRVHESGAQRTYGDWTPDIFPFEQDLSSLGVDTAGLHFSNEQRLVTQISSALAAGDHVVLVGPPGTGKSALARRITEAFVDDQYEMVTATADWSTFNTIGGYRVKQGNNLRFQPGVFLQRFQDSNYDPQLEWLIVDELNRADIDKAFGSLFSAIVGDSVQTPFTNGEGEIVEVLGPSDSKAQIADHRYYIPEDWRLITTMNTYDKTSLYEMSYAFMRRFAFIHVEPPREVTIDDDLVESYADEWEIEAEDLSGPLSAIWKAIQPTRQLGPAVFERVLRYFTTHPGDDLTEPLMMYVLPQLEGLASTRQIELVENILDEEQAEPFLDDGQLVRFAADYFGISPDRFEN